MKKNRIAKKTVGLYRCPECGLIFTEKEWAEKCEAWDKKYHGCSLEIARHAVNKASAQKDF